MHSFFLLLIIVVRLTLQSDVFLRATDNKVLHAPIKLNDDDRVLETATGTGKNSLLSQVQGGRKLNE